MVMIFNLAGTASNNFFTPISFELLDGNFAGVFAFSFIALGISIISSVTYIIMDIKYRDVYIMAEEPESWRYLFEVVFKLCAHTTLVRIT